MSQPLDPILSLIAEVLPKYESMWQLSAPQPNPELKVHHLSAVHECLFFIFAAILQIWRPSPLFAKCAITCRITISGGPDLIMAMQYVSRGMPDTKPATHFSSQKFQKPQPSPQAPSNGKRPRHSLQWGGFISSASSDCGLF